MICPCNKINAGVVPQQCIECVLAYQRKRRIDKGDEIRAYDRDRGQLPHRQNAVKKYQATARGKTIANAAKKAWQERNQLAYACHIITNNAVRDGILVKSKKCESCHKKRRLEGHHDDYNKPLEVEWLCSPCHKAYHKAA